jgi:putative transposase
MPQAGISDATFYNWRKKFGGLGPSEVRRLKQLEEESSKLKRLVADLSLDKANASGRARKKDLKPSRKRVLADDLMSRYGASQRQVWAVLKILEVGVWLPIVCA